MEIEEFFDRRFDETPEVGDHLPIGSAVLVVRDIDDNQVTHAGLQLEAVYCANMQPALWSWSKSSLARLFKRQN